MCLSQDISPWFRVSCTIHGSESHVKLFTMNSSRDFPSPAPLPSRQMLADGVYDAVKEQVMNLSIPPGTKINIDRLARELQVSNTPLREALTRLESEGLVTRRNLRGYWTADLLDEQGMRDYFGVRLLLEPGAAEAAARGPDVKALTAELTEILGQMTRSARQPALEHDYHRYREFAEADARFHRAIATASGNALLASILAGMNAHAHNYRFYFRGGMADTTVAEHRAILDGLTDRNPGEAMAAMRTHLEHARDRLLPLAASPDGDKSQAVQ
jgi:DNA-binding GntR family transcriptional regulator